MRRLALLWKWGLGSMHCWQLKSPVRSRGSLAPCPWPPREGVWGAAGCRGTPGEEKHPINVSYYVC